MINQIKKIKIKGFEPLEALASFSKHVAQEGIVLLKNEQAVLPLFKKRVAVFGRIQFNYYKSGTGSGGLVNVRHVPSFIEVLQKEPNIKLDQSVLNTYAQWIEEFPFDSGNGQWASEPWNQNEMAIDESLVAKSGEHNDVAVVIFGRTAGEDKDNHASKGSYYLTDVENDLLKKVTTHFKQTVVILNVGNPIDMTFMDEYSVDGLVYAWHGGGYGADALKDVLMGYSSPSGKLPMTMIKDLRLDPSYKNFGHKGKVYYQEDIYVGYRYFETFNPEAVRYPFGFGLSYTSFKVIPKSFDVDDKTITFNIEVINKGKVAGKEVVQIYLEAPQGLLGKPKRTLAGFVKTKLLQPKTSELLEVKIDLFNLASYDDEGLIYKSCYVLEKGDYHFHVGTSIRDTQRFGEIEMRDDIITLKSEEISAPNEAFKRIKPDKAFNVTYHDVPLRQANYNERILKEVPKLIETNNQKVNLSDVYHKKATLEAFIGSLSVDEMIQLTRGEGMSSPKVTAGTASAFGGVTPSLLKKGIPLVCCADGPSGIRMDSGFYASSLPNGILLASTFNTKLVEMLYQLLGLEMKGYNVDVILGPGMNIHRNPLNGRNFEYYSEDPLLSGMIASSAIKGLQKEGVTGTLKHVFANNQETDRFNVNAIVSERAQREIYLKGFEIAIKDGGARAIMTSYNPVNDLWTASHFEVNKKLIRDEWGFKGILVTDWWAKLNDWGNPIGDVKNTKAMIISQNDLYMVIKDSLSNSNDDNSKESFLNGSLKLEHLQKVSYNILSFILKTPAFFRMHGLPLSVYKPRLRPWMQSNNQTLNLPLVQSILVNDQKVEVNPLIFKQYVESETPFKSIKIKSGDIYHSKDTAIIKSYNDEEQFIYHLYRGKRELITKDLIDLDTLKIDKYPVVGLNAWVAHQFTNDTAIYDSSLISMRGDYLSVDKKDAILSYPVHFRLPGKYVVECVLSSSASSLAQLPFSIFVDNRYHTTITINGTEGKTTHAKATILVDPKDSIISFKFNKSNIELQKITILRHG